MPVIVEAKPNSGGVEAYTPSPRAWVPGGVAVAALMSAALGMLTLAVVNVFTTAFKGFSSWVHAVGELWMPGAAGIGPYSGKETLAALVWVLSWIVLHYALRRTQVDISRWLIVFLLGVGLATTLVWPPVFEHLAEYLAGH